MSEQPELFANLTTYRTADGRTAVYQKRGKHYIEPRGYADKPGTGPKAETCGSCKNIIRGRRYAKCNLTRAAWSHTRRTDILVGAVACSKWQRGGDETVKAPEPVPA